MYLLDLINLIFVGKNIEIIFDTILDDQNIYQNIYLRWN